MALEHDIVSFTSSRLIYKNIEQRRQLVEDCLYALPIEAHGTSTYSNMCLSCGVKILKAGIDIGIYPEGAYVKEDVIHKGRTGAIRILFDAVSEKVPVNLIPVAISVDKENCDLDSYLFENDKVVVKFLEPIKYQEDYETFISSFDFDIRNECLHHVMDTSLRKIASSLGKEYSDTYIELFPKKNVIYANGVVLPTDLAQDSYYVELYRRQLEKDSDEIIQKIKKK